MKRFYEDKLFTNAFHFASIGMAIVSPEGKWLNVNASLCEIMGYSEKELEQMTFQDITFQEDLELDLKHVKEMLNGDIQFYEMEKRYIHKSGKLIWGLLSVSLVRDEQNNPLYFISQIQDITERKDLKEKLEKSEEKFRVLVQYSPEPMIIHAEGRIEYINEAGVKTVGASNFKDIIGRKIVDFIHPDHREHVFKRIEKMITLNQHQDFEPYDSKIIDIHGNEIDVRFSSVPIDYQGKKAIQVFFSNITDRKKMEEAIRKNEAQYKSLIKYNPDAVFGFDIEGNFILANQSCQRITGYTEEDFLSMSFHSIVIEDDIEKASNSFDKSLKGETEGVDVTIRKKNGDHAMVNVTSIPIIIDQTVKGLYTIAKDVTEQRRIEKELQESNERFKAIFEKSGIGIILRDYNGELLEVNPTYLDMLGYSKEEIFYFEDHIYHPDDIEEEKRLFSELVEGKRNHYQLEKRYICKDGKILFANITVNALNNLEEGRIYALGLVYDITDRKLSEQFIKESEERFRLLAEYSSDMITLHDVEGKYLYASPACKRILQYEEEQMIGKDAYLFIHPDDQEIIEKHHQELLENGYTTSSYRIRSNDGSYIWFESSIRLLDDSKSENRKFIVVSRNINERKLTEQKLKEANEILQNLSMMDGLTAISNRRSFDEVLEKEWKRAAINSTPISLIMLDIDHFKAYNDTYGHKGGDECLKIVAQTLRDSTKFHKDFVARYGGEEFSVILPETSQEEALVAAKRLRSTIEELKIPHLGSKISPYVTISLGVATITPTPQRQSKELIEKADKALYSAKGSGRNQVGVYKK